MSLFDRFLNFVRQRPEGQRAYIPRRQGGIVVTEDSAQTYSWVAACVRLRSNTMAALPWQVYRRMATGREAMPSNAVQWILNIQANPEQTAFVLRRTLVANMDLWGNGYAEIERGVDGRALWLWHLPPDRCCVERSADTGELRVEVRVNGAVYVLPRNNVFLLSDGSHDGITGVSRIQLARRTIGAGMAGDEFASAAMQNGAQIGGVISNKGKTLSPEARDLLLNTFDAKYSGPQNARKTTYLDGGHEYEQIDAMPLTDMQFIENRRFQGEDVCRWFDTPLHLVQDTSQANYAISYEASKNFVEHTLRPLATLMEQEANVRLFGSRNMGSVYSRMNLAGLLRADPKTRGEYYRSLINGGVMSINEVRELEELNSIGSDGDEHYIQLNMTTVRRVAEGENMPSEKPAAAAPGAEDPEDENEGITVNVAAPIINIAPATINVAPADVHVSAPNVTVKMPDDGPRETLITERDPDTKLAVRSISRPFKAA